VSLQELTSCDNRLGLILRSSTELARIPSYLHFGYLLLSWLCGSRRGMDKVIKLYV